jgi:hypothetical protein
MESSTHAGRRRAVRALTVGGAAMAVTFAAALPAVADDNVTPTTTVADTAASTTAVTATAAADAGTAVASAVVATTPAADTPAAVNVETSSTTVAPAAPAAPAEPATPNGSPATGTSTSASHSGGTSTANSHGNNANGGNDQGNNGNGGSGGEGPGQTGGHNPPGNNGTVKIHDVAGDTQPYDVPILNCDGYVDFFGFDAEQVVTVTFTGQAPTGKDTPLYTWGPQMISTDDAGGAGNDFDYEFHFTADQLGVSALGAPAHQGYHVKMLVETGEPGGQKYKVFWIQPCQSEETGGGHHHHHHGGGGESGGGHHHHGGGGETTGGTVKTPKVKAVHEHRTVTRTPKTTKVLAVHLQSPSVQSLPFTGTHDLGAQLLAALTALTGGAAFSFAGRRRRTAAVR